MKQTPLTDRRWTRNEYERLGEAGLFLDERLELIGGHLIVAEPKGTYHVTSVTMVGNALRAALPAGWTVRLQDPIALDDDSEPEPDVAVVPGDLTDYLIQHPQRPVLIVEVAESSLAFDRREKASLYARGGVQDYWIVNLIDRVLEVYRDPIADPLERYRWKYQSVERVTTADSVALQVLPSVRIAVRDLLP